MDEIAGWQLEEMQRQVNEIRRWLAQSGAMEGLRQAHQLAADLGRQEQIRGAGAALSDFVQLGSAQQMTRVAEIITDVVNSSAGMTLQITSTYADLIDSLTELHRWYAGTGAVFTVGLGAREADSPPAVQRCFHVPAFVTEGEQRDTVGATEDETIEQLTLLDPPAGIGTTINEFQAVPCPPGSGQAHPRHESGPFDASWEPTADTSLSSWDGIMRERPWPTRFFPWPKQR